MFPVVICRRLKNFLGYFSFIVLCSLVVAGCNSGGGPPAGGSGGNSGGSGGSTITLPPSVSAIFNPGNTTAFTAVTASIDIRELNGRVVCYTVDESEPQYDNGSCSGGTTQLLLNNTVFLACDSEESEVRTRRRVRLVFSWVRREGGSAAIEERAATYYLNCQRDTFQRTPGFARGQVKQVSVELNGDNRLLVVSLDEESQVASSCGGSGAFALKETATNQAIFTMTKDMLMGAFLSGQKIQLIGNGECDSTTLSEQLVSVIN